MKFSVLFFLMFLFSRFAFADSIAEMHNDTLFNSDTCIDSLDIPDSSSQNSSINIPDSVTTATSKASVLTPETPIDSSESSNGLFFGFGSGVTLGDLPILSLWKNSLPDSLGSYGLSQNSFSLSADTSLPDSLQIADTSKLAFSIKEHPSVYNMTFPLRLSMARISDNRIFKTSLTYSFIYKNHKSILFTADDTLNRRIDIKQKLFLHSLSLEFLYGIKIPSQYFSIESIQKSYFLVGLGFSPLLYLKTDRDIRNHSTDERMSQVLNTILVNNKSVKTFGATFTFKTGITAIRSLSSNAIAEFGMFYTLNWFDYFYKDGHRMNKNDLDPTRNDSDNLSFLSNRFEIGVSLYKKHVRK